MATQGKKLSLVMFDAGTGSTYEVTVGNFQKFLRSLMIDEEEIEAKVMKGLEPYKNQLIELGLTEEEADAKIEELLEEEGE